MKIYSHTQSTSGKTKAEMARQLGVHPSTLTRWTNKRDELDKLLHPADYVYY